MRALSCVLVLPLLATGLALPGCIYVNKTNEAPVIALPEGRYTGAIRAAQAVSFSEDRAQAFMAIAGKPDLEECDQHRLIYALRRDDGFSRQKTDVVIALIENPSITNSTRSMIGSSVEDLASFSSDRARIAQALAN